MAGDWIKMRIDLQTHPKVVRILSATKSDKFRVIGGLHAVWSVFDTHCEDGVLNGYTTETLDHIIGWSGFSEALVSVGWLVENTGLSLEIPEFSEHNGQSAKRRAEDQKRKRDSRNRPKVVRILSADSVDTNGTREEKRREDKYISAPEGVNSVVWADFIRQRRAKKAPVTETVIEGIKREALKAGWSLDDALQEICARGWTGFNADWVASKSQTTKSGVLAGAI